MPRPSRVRLKNTLAIMLRFMVAPNRFLNLLGMSILGPRAADSTPRASILKSYPTITTLSVVSCLLKIARFGGKSILEAGPAFLARLILDQRRSGLRIVDDRTRDGVIVT